MTPEQLARLPRYAQDELAVLLHRAERAEKRLLNCEEMKGAAEERSEALLAVLRQIADVAPFGSDARITATTALTNAGTVNFYPVFKVNGPFTAFTLRNNSVLDSQGNPLDIVYDGNLPGAQSVAGGHYAEIDTFRNTVYLDGNLANLKPGINILFSDFWWLQPGTNNVRFESDSGTASVDVLWQAAYA